MKIKHLQIVTNYKSLLQKGSLAEIIKGADVFIGVSAPNC